MPNVFGPMVDGTMVEIAAEETIKIWLPTYLAEYERRHDIPAKTLPALRSFASATEFDHWPEEQLPGCIVISAGLLSPPERYGDGMMSAEWACGVAVLTSGQDRTQSLRLAKIYIACIRWLMLQHPSLGGFATEVRWVDETYDDMAPEMDRTLANGILQLGVRVENVVDARTGPITVPTPDPYTPPPEPHTVETVFIKVDAKE